MLKSLTLLPDRIPTPLAYPFTVPAIALSYGLSLTGGNRNFNLQPDDPTDDTQPLARALRLGSFPARTGNSNEQAPPTRIVRRFLNDRTRFLADLFHDPPTLFDP